jgi:cellulose synthase/poly-beta-1,6-N-acetylglucosamine synthase-like glycosyltransferase
MALAADAYLHILPAAASRADPATDSSDGNLRLTVLIPAHDEAASIVNAVDGILACDYPSDSRRVVVIADNCSDATPTLAQRAGADVWERKDATRRGKGQALAWALERLLREDAQTDAVVIFDADCVPSRNLLDRLAARLSEGADAAQARVSIADPEVSTAAALRYGASTLMNLTRPLGKEALGFSCGLQGTGMAFSRGTLETVPWNSFSLTEDREYHLNLIEAGRRVRFVADAQALTPAPATRVGADMQETRWDAGNVSLARAWVPRLERPGPGPRRQRLHAALELTIPPQAAISGLWALGLATSVATRRPGLRRLSLAAAAGHVTYVVVGLKSARVPSAVWQALPKAPFLVARRLMQIARLVARPPTDWQRTERPASP